MLIGRCSSQLSGHRKLKKSQPLGMTNRGWLTKNIPVRHSAHRMTKTAHRRPCYPTQAKGRLEWGTQHSLVSEITKKVTASRDDNLEARTFIKESRKKRAGATKLHKNSGKRVVGTLSRNAKALLRPLMYFFRLQHFFCQWGRSTHKSSP